MRIAYLTNQYPAVSHTFIRREIRGLESRGVEVARFAVRPSSGKLVDPADHEEFERTTHLLGMPKPRLLGMALMSALSRPLSAFRGFRESVRLGAKSLSGRRRHFFYWLEALAMVRLLRADGAGHVHVHFGTNASTVALLVRVMGGPGYSFTVHGPDEFDAVEGHNLRAKIEHAEFVVAISDFCRSQLQRWSDPREWDKLHVVRCTVGPTFLDEPPHPEHDARTVVSVGRLSAQKSQLILVEAIAILKDRGVDARLVLVGDGELRAQVEEAVRARGVEDRVTLTGSLPESGVREQILNARGLVMSSSAEGLPTVLMESLAMRRPVISTAIAACGELVEPGVNGWLVPAGRADRVADAVQELLSLDQARWEAMGEAGAEAVARQHHTGTECGKLVELFRRYVEESGRD
ncbi:MAG: glycosyltransferase [Phycisphaerales bacterium JB040]